jgi:hypothetical protein
MAHAETCPVCGGCGITPSTTDDKCHGCNGKGWVEVGNSGPTTYPAPMPYPLPYPPYREWPRVTWVYLSERGLFY